MSVPAAPLWSVEARRATLRDTGGPALAAAVSTANALTDKGDGMSEEALRNGHTARARSAFDRTKGACRFAGVEADPTDVIAVPTADAAKAANAIRLSADAVAALTEGTPDPAADARHGRNAAAAAVLAAQLAQAQVAQSQVAQSQVAQSQVTESQGADELSDAAYHAALKASQAVGTAAGREGLGRNEALNAAADEAEAAAVAAARAAGWLAN